ncbi:hypothetical protein [Paraburkholderia acidipaludis]|uniref:hypothetical protein n=1 Tax=Paraburkholderia acidipaludis TaxID=660537 RepID=UPI000487ACD7|nr:hypothetical protein [Paraburkholderia acidipaludis]
MTTRDDESTPTDPAVAARVAEYDEDAREWFVERAAIREFDGGLPRPEAERLALEDTERWLARRSARSS